MSTASLLNELVVAIRYSAFGFSERLIVDPKKATNCFACFLMSAGFILSSIKGSCIHKMDYVSNRELAQLRITGARM